MSKTDVLVASNDILMRWVFKSGDTSKLTVVKEHQFHIDELSIIGTCPPVSDSLKKYEKSDDPITCVAISETVMIVGRSSGYLFQYSFPTLELSNKYTVSITPTSIFINCNATRISILDSNGILKLFDLEPTSLGNQKARCYLIVGTIT